MRGTTHTNGPADSQNFTFNEGLRSASKNGRLDQSENKQFYFNPVPFNAESLDPTRYLIVGRRGCGKSSLSHFFGFQELRPNLRYIEVDEPEVYELVLERMGADAAKSGAVALARCCRRSRAV